MDFLQLAKKRTIAFEFLDKAVADKDLQLVLEAGRLAPSSHNSQPWSFIVVREKEQIRKVMQLCYYGTFHFDPPLLIVAVLEPASMKVPNQQAGKSEDLGETHQYFNLMCPVLQMVYEAESLGFNSCILSVRPKEANKVLGVPAGKSASLVVGLGYERPGAYHSQNQRKPLESIVHYERYGSRK